MRLLLIIFSIFLIKTGFSCVFLNLEEGIIKGRIARIPGSEKTFYSFQEIPYAAPPIENLRFQPPTKVSEWNDVLDTTRNTKICYQIGNNVPTETEDCLYLNVYTPKLPPKKVNESDLLPVMVFIHGGGFIVGDAKYESYGPEFLVNRDVVVVTLNYRLGVFGFLSTQDDVLPGNNGLKDQLFALQWINKNIYLFGGNALKVTIFGQSAGAASIGYHLSSKKSLGLYRAAIMESSSVLNPFGYQRNAKYYAYKIASYIDPNISETSTSEEILSVMIKASAKEIDEASDKIAAEEDYTNVQLFQGYYFAPVIELEGSTDAFITEKMFEVLNRGGASKVPIIIGINSEESISQSTSVTFLQKLMAKYDENIKALVPNDMNIADDATKEEVGRFIRKLYSGDDLLQNVSSAGVRYMSDTTFTRAVIQHALLQSTYSDVYFYQFSYDGNLGNVSVVVDGAERVGHNEELAYIWRIRNDMFDNYKLEKFPESDITVQNRLLTLWTNFAKTLNPTPQKMDLLQDLIWPKVESENDFQYLDIDENMQIKRFPKETSFREWKNLYDKYGQRPFDSF